MTLSSCSNYSSLAGCSYFAEFSPLLILAIVFPLAVLQSPRNNSSGRWFWCWFHSPQPAGACFSSSTGCSPVRGSYRKTSLCCGHYRGHHRRGLRQRPWRALSDDEFGGRALHGPDRGGSDRAGTRWISLLPNPAARSCNHSAASCSRAKRRCTKRPLRQGRYPGFISRQGALSSGRKRGGRRAAGDMPRHHRP